MMNEREPLYTDDDVQDIAIQIDCCPKEEVYLFALSELTDMRDKLQARIAELEANQWTPVERVEDGNKSVEADSIAITIGYYSTAQATFVWPEEGEYAVCRRKESGK